MRRSGIICLLLALALGGFVACGGGGGGGGDGDSSAARTTFTGNLTEATALGDAPADRTALRTLATIVAGLLAATHAQAADVQVCVEGTSFCTVVDDAGFFTLAADVGGRVLDEAAAGVPLATTITWFGHNCWSIETAGATILLDPFLNDSPTSGAT